MKTMFCFRICGNSEVLIQLSSSCTDKASHKSMPATFLNLLQVKEVIAVKCWTLGDILKERYDHRLKFLSRV